MDKDNSMGTDLQRGEHRAAWRWREGEKVGTTIRT